MFVKRFLKQETSFSTEIVTIKINLFSEIMLNRKLKVNAYISCSWEFSVVNEIL